MNEITIQINAFARLRVCERRTTLEIRNGRLMHQQFDTDAKTIAFSVNISIKLAGAAPHERLYDIQCGFPAEINRNQQKSTQIANSFFVPTFPLFSNSVHTSQLHWAQSAWNYNTLTHINGIDESTFAP